MNRVATRARPCPARTVRLGRPAPTWIYIGLGLALIVAIGLAAKTGQIATGWADLAAAFWPGSASGHDTLTDTVVWQLRLPRALMALVVGAALAMSGAALQGLFGNPLADPGIVGVSAGASLGAVAVIVLGWNALGAWTLPVGAFAGGMATTGLIYRLASRAGERDNATLLLIGIAIQAVTGALTGYLTYLASAEQLESLLFWTMGSLASAHWQNVAIVCGPVVVGGLWLWRLAPPLDLLALGERQARHAGVDVKRLRRGLITLTALLTASAVAFTGTIGFVGLVVPHLVRLGVGPGHRHLLPLSALGGGLLLVLADIGARSLNPPSEIPIGILTASLGGPFFLWLIARGRARA